MRYRELGGVSEWFKEAVLKTVVPQGTGGSNPSSSASCCNICGERREYELDSRFVIERFDTTERYPSRLKGTVC